MSQFTLERQLKILAMSNGTMHGMTFFEHGLDWIKSLVPNAKKAVFIPFAAHDHSAYTAEARTALEPLGIATEIISEEALEACDLVVTGGGNSFRLLDRLQRSGLFEKVRGAVNAGLPYAGASAGAIITGQTIMTTNDMPIVAPRSLDAYAFLPFQINAHYFDPDETSTHMGETRAERIAEYHEEQSHPVVGLREGSALYVSNGQLQLLGAPGAKIFLKGQTPFETSGDILRDIAQAQ